MKKFLLTASFSILTFLSIAQTKDQESTSSSELYKVKKSSVEMTGILKAVDPTSDTFFRCQLRYEFINTANKTFYVVYDPNNVPAANGLDLSKYVNKKIKLVGTYIEFEILMEQTTSRSGLNPCRSNAIYAANVLPVQ